LALRDGGQDSSVTLFTYLVHSGASPHQIRVIGG
jgi:hypothetical protein